MKKLFIIISYCFFLPLITIAQYTKTITVNADSANVWTISHDEEISAFSISASSDISASGSFCINEKDTFLLKNNEDVFNDTAYLSDLVIFDNSTDSFYLHTGGLSGQVSVHIQFVPEMNVTAVSHTKSGCEAPSAIDQSVWRSGLTEPDYTRIYSDVQNIIIHHSAGSNTADNYTDIVRNIYVYHTETNGWSDIGYNYLIAQDGTIYSGRDPGTYDQDEVQGAHFCASNKNTLGICMLGNYETAEVPEAALESLYLLLAWKCSKNDLNPLGIHSHALNDELPVIAGHRDGCSTDCPGENLYVLLDDIRKETSLIMIECDDSYTAVNSLEINEVPFLITGSSVTFLSSGNVSIFTLTGKQVINKDIEPGEAILRSSLPSGILVLSMDAGSYKILN